MKDRLRKVQTIFESICRKIQLESGMYMDGWIKLPKKREKTIYLREENNSPYNVTYMDADYFMHADSISL